MQIQPAFAEAARMVGARRAFAALEVLALIVGFAESQPQDHKIDGEVWVWTVPSSSLFLIFLDFVRQSVTEFLEILFRCISIS